MSEEIDEGSHPQMLIADYIVPANEGYEMPSELRELYRTGRAKGKVDLNPDGSRRVRWWYTGPSQAAEFIYEYGVEEPTGVVPVHILPTQVGTEDVTEDKKRNSWAEAHHRLFQGGMMRREELTLYDYSPTHESTPNDAYYLAAIARHEQRLLGPFRSREEYTAAAERFAFDARYKVVVIGAP